MEMNKLEQVQKWVADNHLDFAYLNDPTMIQYLTGYYGEPEERIMSLLVFPDQEPFMFAPALQVEEIEQSGFDHPAYGYLDQEDPWKIIAEHVQKRNSNPKHAAIEFTSLEVAKLKALEKAFNGDVEFNTNITPFLEHMRLFKSPNELKLLREAGEEADFAFKTGFEATKVGASEREIASHLERELAKHYGVRHMSFETLVQAGKHASEPHSTTTMNKVQDNQLVLFDLGTVHKGYMSDSSRTVAVGKPSDKELDMYKVCQEAQQKAMDAAKPGITAEELDKVARDVIDKAGYGKYFIHRLGHGIGMSCHEFPSIMQGNSMELKPGMCFSIEPGIYVPGVAGVRIEDCIHMTKNGNEPFTHTSKELTQVDK